MILYIIILIGIISFISILINSKNLTKSFDDNKDKIQKYSNELFEIHHSIKESIHSSMQDTMTGIHEGYIYEPNEIFNEKTFHDSFDALVEVESDYDRKRNVLKVNQCEHYMVKYYAKHILKYGTNREKAIYYNNVKLLIQNKIINE